MLPGTHDWEPPSTPALFGPPLGVSSAGDAPSSRIFEAGGYTVVEFHGEIDILGLELLGPRMDDVTSSTGIALVIDLRPATFFDCSGLALLCRVRTRVNARAGMMRLICDNDLILRTMRVGGLLDVFRPVPTLEEAMTNGVRREI